MSEYIMKIVNVVICYENLEEVVAYAKQFQNVQNQNEIELVVVINKLEDKNQVKLLAETLYGLKIKFRIYNPNKNLGYLNGMIYGYRQYRKEKSADWIIMSNTDIVYDVWKFLSYLSNRKYEEDIWCIGPSIYADNRKSYDNPVAVERRKEKRIRRIIRMLRIPIINIFYVGLSDVKARIFPHQKGVSQFVYEVHGCFFIVRKELADLLIEKEFPAFLYSEELYIAEMCYQYGKKIFYDTELEVKHLEHSVTGLLKKRKIAKYVSESLQIMLDMFY